MALVFGGSLFLESQPTAAADGEKEDLPPLELPKKGNPKLDSQLNQLVSAQTSRRAASFAQDSNIELVDGNVRVIVESLPDEVDAAVKAASAVGIVETSYRNLLQVLMPVSQLPALSDTHGVRFVRLPSYPLAADNVSEGVALINADDWQNASYNGTGVKVGILDGGFSGYTTRQSEGELPATVTTWWAPSIGNEGTSVHGTGCAEIVYDIAPDADFYLANFITDVEMGNAVDWLIAQGVDVISCSMGWPIGGPGDGTGSICEMVNNARAAGILWSQSIGNSAQRHWQGAFSDTDTDNWTNFSGTDEGNSIYANSGNSIRVGLKWDDNWGSSNNDYDLYLVDNTSTIVWGSINPQDGDDDPCEFFTYTAPSTGWYGIAIYKYNATSSVNFHLYSYNHNLEYQVASSSFAVPADSANATAVGAVFWNNPTVLESFSSQGPTDDSRIKPDLVAPDGVSSATYGASNGVDFLSGGTGFFGTSASAPHVAGAAALVKQCYPSYTPAQIQSFLEGRAVELGAAGKDNLYGSGRLYLGSVPPTMEPIAELQGQYYNTAPILSNFGFDDDEALDDGWYQMDSYNGTWATLFTDVGATFWDSDNWTIPDFAGLSEGTHTVYFKASDNSTNVEGESGEWSWQFYKDTGPPNDPTSVNSTSHSLSTWSSDNTVDVSWTDATDNLSGLDGYSVLWNTSANTTPSDNKTIEEGVQTATSSELADGSSYYFHIRSVDNVGNWQSTVHLGPFYIETVPPTDPTSVTSPSHSLSTWSNDNTVNITWTDATDGTSGLDGYSVLWDISDNTTPSANKTIEEEVQTVISSALADGNSHYFHIRSVDNAGNWQSTVHYGPFFIDTTPPSDPTGISSSPTTSVWSSDNTVDVSWTDATDNNSSGLDGYSILWDTSANTTPSANKTIEEGVQTTTSSELADGNSHYLHIRSVDNLGNWQSTAHIGPFYIAVYSPVLADGAVSPTSGYTSATYTFSVNYTDFEDEAPSSITISIDGGASENMTVKLGQDYVYTNGEIYEYSISGASLGTGSHTFQFAANDGTDDAIGDTGSNAGPTVSSPPSPPGGGNGGGGGGGGGGGATDDTRITAFGDIIKDSGEVWESVVALSLDNKLSLHIPPGTFAKNRADAALYALKIKTLAEPPEVPENMEAVGSVYELLPKGAKFDPPITLTIKYDVSEIPEGVSESNLYIAKWIESSQEWTELESTVDTASQTIATKIDGFSIHTIMASTLMASFTLTDLTINPEIIEAGDSIDISVILANTGNLAGSYEVSLVIDDVLEQVQEVTLDSGESEQVSFIITPDTIGEHTINVGGLLGTCKVEKPKAPAAFSVSDLSISPVELLTGGRVTISLTLTNTGGRSGTHDVSLKIDGVQIETKMIPLEAGESQKVVFAVIPDTAGTYSVDIDGLPGSFVVIEITPAPAEEEKMTAPAPAVTPTMEPGPAPEQVPKPKVNLWTIVGIIVVTAIAGLASYYFIKKKRKMV